jgi:hypothetical protein
VGAPALVGRRRCNGPTARVTDNLDAVELERRVRDLLPRTASRLERAVVADQIAEVAMRVARSEVMSARHDGSTWSDVAEAFGVRTQTAHERFRSGPDGLHSRFAQREQASSAD